MPKTIAKVESPMFLTGPKGEKLGVIISIEEYQRLKSRPKTAQIKGKVKFGSGHLGNVQGELSREDIYCDR